MPCDLNFQKRVGRVVNFQFVQIYSVVRKRMTSSKLLLCCVPVWMLFFASNFVQCFKLLSVGYIVDASHGIVNRNHLPQGLGFAHLFGLYDLLIYLSQKHNDREKGRRDGEKRQRKRMRASICWFTFPVAAAAGLG